VCVQLRTSAVNVTLLAFAAVALLLPRARRPALSIDVSCRHGAQQQTRRSGARRANDGTDTQTDGHPTVSQTGSRILRS